MALVLKDRVKETSTTTGTGTFTLAGAASGFQSFSVIGDGNTTYYTIDGGTEWEVGIGTYTLSGTTLSRDTILESSNSGSAVNFSAGTKNVFVTYPAERALYTDASSNSIGLGTPASATLTNATGLPLTTGVTGTLPVANGGTNQTSYTNGQLLIGNTTGNTLAKATLTAGTGISVTNGAGSITIANSAASIIWQSVQTSGFTAVSGNGYPCNTTSAAFTVTLPASPTAGNIITLTDYAGTWATNNITIGVNGNKLNGVVNNATLSTTRQSISLVYIDATQGWIAYNGFLDKLPAQPYTASYLIVAGGGGGAGTPSGGNQNGGGGGAGGYQTSTTTLTPGTTYTATVGAGGAAASSTQVGFSGSNSSFTGLTASVGGGGGGNHDGGGATSGGSGGGGSRPGAGTGAGGAGTSGQGNAGGSSSSTLGTTAGGGGGAGAVGSNGSGLSGNSNGGAGTASSITGSSVTYAGGGGGGRSTNVVSGGHLGGAGGGGNGATTTAQGTAGSANTGGGGGASYGTGISGSAGGSGIIILSVPTANYSGTTTGSPTITTSGSNTIIKFTASGTYTA